MAQNNINVKLELEVKDAKAKIEALEKEIKELGNKENKTNKETKQFEKNLQDVNKKSQDLTKTLSGLALKIGLAFGAGEVIRNMAEFQASISKLGAISGATKAQMEELRQKAIDLGGSSIYSSGQVAEAMNYLAMAGFKTNQILKATGDVLNLATIGQMDLARASDIASNILTGFGLKAQDTKQVVDVMTATITNSNTNISQMGEAMKYVAPQARAMKINIQETSAAIGILGNAGIQGTMAGTGLAGMLTRLAKPTAQAQKVLNELGISAYDAKGNFKGLGNVLMLFKNKLKGLTNQQRLRVLATIFGQEHLKDAIVLINSMSGAYQNLLNHIDNSAGLSKRIAQEMQDNLLGAWRSLMSSLDKLQQTIGHDLLPVLTAMIKDLTKAVNAGTEFYKNNKALIQTLGELAITIYGFVKLKAILEGVFGTKAVFKMKSMIKGVKKLKEAFIALKTAIMGLSVTTMVLGSILAALMGVIYALNEFQSELDKFNETTEKAITNNNNFKNTFNDLYSHMAKRGVLTATANEIKEMTKKIKDNLKNTENLIKEFKNKINDYSWYNKLQDKIFGIDRIKNYKRQLDILTERHEILEKELKKVEETKPFEAKNLNAKKYTKTLYVLTQAQQNYLKELNKKLLKLEQVNSTQKQGMQDEINRARRILGLTTQFEEAKAKIKKIYALKEIATFRKEYQTRIREHTNTINKLEAKEKSLTDRIVQLQKQLNARLKNLENERILAIGNIEDRIKNLQMSGASEYQKYVMIKERADKKYALAKEALEAGNFQLAKSYMSQYSSLISRISNKEIKENGRVVVTKEQANNVAIANLKKLESLTNTYYAKEKQNAINAYNNKIRLIKAQLEATKEQLKLEVQRLNLEKQMIQIMTGKKVTIDTSGALTEIKNLDKEIKNLDNQIKSPKKIKVTADTSEAKQKVNNETKQFESKKITAKVEADTSEAKNKIAGILEITDKLTGKTKVFKIRANGAQAESEINKLKKPTQSRHSVKLPNIGQVENKIESLNGMNTSSTHTIYIREVHTKATGGIMPLKRATGGDVEFKRQNGRIAGYDPHDSDDVPALLTRGEFVIKRDAVTHYGDSFLYALNNKLLPKFATGGIVQAGNPQKITKDLKNTLNDMENQNNGADIDLSKIDDLIESLKQLAETFKKGGVFDKSNEVFNLISSLKIEKEKITKQAEKVTGDEKQYSEFKNSVKGKVLTQEQEKQFELNLEAKKNNVVTDNNKLNLLNKEKQKILENVSNKIKYFNDYLQEVENIKNKISNKLSDFGLNADDFNGLEESINLDKLNKFYTSLNNLKTINNNEIQAKFNKYIQRIIKREQEFYYGQGSIFSGRATGIFMENMNPNGYAFLENAFGIRNNKLAKEIPTNFSYRTFGGNYKLPDNVVKDISSEYLKEHLPKFQTGGLLQLQTGGKLPGYGGGDRNLALLEDGEFVIRKEAVNHFGADLFSKLNGLKLPKFQTGGYIGNLGNSGNIARDSVDVNLNLGKKSYKMSTNKNVAEELVRELKKLM